MFERIKHWARQLKKQVLVLYLAYKDPRVSIFAKIFVAIIVAYAFSPIDLIPDFIPILGYLDDVILIPLGIYFALKLIPNEVIIEYTEIAQNKFSGEKPKNWFVGALILLMWISIFITLVLMFLI